MTINNCDSNIPHVKGGSTFSVDWRFMDQYEEADLTGINPVETDGAVCMTDMDMDVIHVMYFI